MMLTAMHWRQVEAPARPRGTRVKLLPGHMICAYNSARSGASAGTGTAGGGHETAFGERRINGSLA
jgi:hypothetical protein